MKRILLFALIASITACEPAKEKDKNDGTIRLKDAEVLVGGGPRNTLKYAQSESPHRLISKNFLFSNKTGFFVIQNMEIATTNCLKSNADVSFLLMSADKMSKLENEQTFGIKSGDQFQVVVDNPGECKGISVSFEIATTQN